MLKKTDNKDTEDDGVRRLDIIFFEKLSHDLLCGLLGLCLC